MLSCVAFVPVALAGLAVAMYAHAALSGAACHTWPSWACHAASGVPIWPIGLGLPAGRYAQSSGSGALWVGVTGRASSTDGWDVLEHYEVIAAGGLPYILHLCAAALRPRLARTLSSDLSTGQCS